MVVEIDASRRCARSVVAVHRRTPSITGDSPSYWFPKQFRFRADNTPEPAHLQQAAQPPPFTHLHLFSDRLQAESFPPLLNHALALLLFPLPRYNSPLLCGRRWKVRNRTCRLWFEENTIVLFFYNFSPWKPFQCADVLRGLSSPSQLIKSLLHCGQS